MNINTPSHSILFQEKLKRWSRYLAYAVIGIGLLVLSGWQFDIDFFKRPIPWLAAMNPTSAVLFVLSGLAFLSLSPGKAPQKMKPAGYLLAALVFVSAFVKMLDVFTNFKTGVDLFIFSEAIGRDFNNKFSGTMAPITAFSFLLIAAALFLLHTGGDKKITPVQVISLALALVSLLSILGCIYNVQPFYMKLVYIPMAIHTAIGFLLMSLAFLFSHPTKGFMKQLTGHLSGSQAARFLIPAAILIPMALGYLRLLGHWAHAFSTEFGVAILVLSIIIVFVMLIWFNANSLNKKDVLRIEAETKLNTYMRQLEESEEKFHKAFEVSAAGMSITRLSDSRYLEVNDAFVQMTGFSKKELINHTSTELGIVTNIDRREEVLQEIRKNGYAKQFEMTIRHKNGGILEILASVETITLNGEKYALNIIFDITNRKNAEMQLEAVNKELEAFSYSISHDLRAPLRAIDGYAKMLEEDYQELLNREGKEFIEVIQYNAKKMSFLIDDLLAFSRLGRKTIYKAELDMNELVTGVIADLGRATPHHAEISVQSLHPVKGDSSMIKQVFTNLLSNAIKYSSKKQNPVIGIRAEQKGDEVLFEVTDNGEGFDMAYVDKLFGVFQRLHSDEEFEGTGVGLAIVQRIVNKHGGRVWARGELGKGSTFSFTLPLT